ncbi:hypothetical protein KAR91_23630 [Candidatus Pacearchaeota archaeon]|nr:hypothetical protein [Candidatus Pacearchaeota archaeon]
MNSGTVVALCCPSGEMMYAHTSFDMSDMIAYTTNKGIKVATINRQQCYLGPSRNELVEEAKKVKADYLFFEDSDMRAPKDTIIRLMSHRKEIVGCNYRRRRPPYAPIISKDVNGKRLDYKKGGVVNIGKIPTGMLLIDMKVFDKIPQPYFVTLHSHGGNSFLGEDLFFCQEVKKEGIRVYCDLDLSEEIGHTVVSVIYLNSEKGVPRF